MKVLESIVEMTRDHSDSIGIPTELGTYIIFFFVMSVQLVYISHISRHCDRQLNNLF